MYARFKRRSVSPSILMPSPAFSPTVSLTTLAPAKLNLYLHLTGRRACGYHELDGLFVFADVGDVVSIAPDDTFSFCVDGPFANIVSHSDDNLVVKAVLAFAEVAGQRPKFRLKLTKNLPVAAGIGGGSADAAATLRLMNNFWPNLRSYDLQKLALNLGADIPACMVSRPVSVSGIGERLMSAPALRPLFMVLINDGHPISTADVFEQFHFGQNSFSASRPLTSDEFAKDNFIPALADRRNDLEAAAKVLHPNLKILMENMRQAKGCVLARMSGSGGTIFGLFFQKLLADAAAKSLQYTWPLAWVRCAAMLSNMPPVTVFSSAETKL